MTEKYNASSIRALDQHTHLIKRLSLTFGAPESSNEDYSSQKNVSIREILDNSLDEVRGGYGQHVKIKFFKDRSIEIQDSGRGIPVDIGKDHNGKSASGIYLALGLIQSGGKFNTDNKRFSSGLNGVGASSTNHVSKRFDVTVYRDGKEYSLSFKDGTPGFFDVDDDPDSKFTPLKDLTKLKTQKDSRTVKEKKNYKTGTRVKFWIRDEVFSSDNPYNPQDIVERLRGTAFLVPQLHAEVYNELNEIENPETGKLEPQHEEFHFPNGVEELIELNQPDAKLHELIHINTEGSYIEKNVPVLTKDGKVVNQDIERHVPIEVAFRYGDKYDTSLESYVNAIHTKLHGSHVTAFERAMTAAFNDRFSSMRGLLKKGDDLPIPEDFLEGLTAVVSVQVSEPQFTSQSKEALSGREVQKAIQASLTKEFEKWIADRKNSKTLELIAKKVSTAAKNRQAAKEQRELNRKKNAIASSSLPAKLIDCELVDTEDAELYICEGDSAKTSLKDARNGQVNALLPIRGKIINAHKSKVSEVFANKEAQAIIKTLGAGSGKDFDFSKIRYSRVFIAVDADPDGNNIACLLYALFWHLFKDVILEGRLYKIETPLFVVATNQGAKSQKHYARDDKELKTITKKLDQQKIKYSSTRLKGLGEVQAEDLEKTAINPETRVVTQITIDDVDTALEWLDVTLGSDTAPRKKWIEDSEVDEELLKE